MLQENKSEPEKQKFS